MDLDRVLGGCLIEKLLGWACGDCLILGVGVVDYMTMSNDGEDHTKHDVPGEHVVGCIAIFFLVALWKG
jgi:hypothetical protein